MNFRKVLPLAVLALASFLPDAGAVLSARHSHTITLLPDGNLLIAGGVDAGNTVTRSVQLYNMGTNLYEDWEGGISLDTARSSHTATVMSDGRVLIAGGYNNAGTPLSSLEICNPLLKTCTAAGIPAMSTQRGGHTATLLSVGPNAGRVLLCGGATTIEAAAHGTITGSCESYNPALNTVSPAAPLISPRMGHAALLLRSGKVFVTGGRRWNTTVTPNAWLYEPMNEVYSPDTLTGAWTPKDALLQGRIDHSATVLNNGTIIIAGGFNNINTYKCTPSTMSPVGVGEECWTKGTGGDEYYWGYGIEAQDMGSHGYLDGAEYFDQNGGRTVIGETTFGTAPYRVHKHSAVLRPDGAWNMYGGYGGIVRTLFSTSLPLETDTVFNLTRHGAFGVKIADITNTSVVKFPVITTLSRAVSGRLVNADAFFSTPLKPADNPSVAVETVKLYLTHSTATLDGYKVGTYIDALHYPGDFDDIMQLENPAGTATFEEQMVESDPLTYSDLVITASDIHFVPVVLETGTVPVPITANSTITGEVALILSNMYRGIEGVATITSGSILDPAMVYSVTISPGAIATVDIPSSYEPDNCVGNICRFKVRLTFNNIAGTVGNIADIATGSKVNSHLNTAGGALTLSLKLSYIAEQVRTLDRQPSFVHGRSDIVIREMIYSSALGFSPKENKWKDLSDIGLSPTIGTPVFNHTALLTPAADTLILGGRNCETVSDCLNRTFTARAAGTVVLPVRENWPASEKLNSKRAFHTSTLLGTGRILTCGGSDGVRPLATCELMDPADKKWTPTGSMNFARTKHTATLLPNGNVLVAGGATPSSAAVSTAEIYYPDTQRWITTSSMGEARQNHTATVLPDGNVLVAGGGTLTGYSDTTEIFISSNSYWQPTGLMSTGRAQHTATLLKSGNVLLTGGVGGFGAVGDSEVFSYTSRTFVGSPVPLKTARYAHTATLLRDGRVLAIGGSNNYMSQITAEIYNGASWTYLPLMNMDRANHRSVLLPNGTVMVTGGETPGASQTFAESYSPDFQAWGLQGEMTTGRANHTTVLTRDNYILNIGGWDGSKYLDTTDVAYFSYSPDSDGLEAEVQRQPRVSSGDAEFNWGANVTLRSDLSNFHGISEASGGGAGPVNSSYSNPRLYIQQIDNQSGFMTDLSTRIYSYAGNTANWERTLSSITVIMPAATEAGELPHGWYNMRVAANGQFSEGHPVQVTIDRPLGTPSSVAGTVIGANSVLWSWQQGGITAAEGYNVYSATDSVFITTATFRNDAATVYHTQAGLAPNTGASIMVAAYNQGGNGPLAKSATYYTLAARPEPLRINTASFETAELEWARNVNSGITTYEVSMSPSKSPPFSSALDISTPVPFSVNYTSTSTVLTGLSANQPYDFRVRAMNGPGLPTQGVMTAFSTPASTVTVSGVSNFTGTALSSSTINWSWDAALGADYYELYDITSGTITPSFIGSTAENNLSQTGLRANRSYKAAVGAVKTTTGGPIRGAAASASEVFTFTVQPLPATPNIYTKISTDSFTVNWITNGNSTWTVYRVMGSTNSLFDPSYTFTTTDNSLPLAMLEPNVRYHLRVTPLNGDGIEGPVLNLGSQYTLANVPANLAATDISMSGIWLLWDTNGNSPETIYEVRASTNENFSAPIRTPDGMKFSNLLTDNYAFVNGLLTSTTYYFDVAACNGEGISLGCTTTGTYANVGITARKRAPAAFTKGLESEGAPPGSVGGTSDPTRAVTIYGTLLNNRAVQLDIPAGAFTSPTGIAVSSSSYDKCGYLAGGVTPVTVEIFSQGQPQEPVILTLHFDQDSTNAKNDIIAKASQIVMARYNPVSQECLPLETKVNIGARTITATLNHFSLFQLMVRTAASNLNNVLIYPNPYYPNRGQGFMTIDKIPASSKVRIYTLTGDKVWEATAGTTGVIIWKGVNKSGYLVASGIYLAVIDSSAGKKVFKLAVER